MRKMYDSDTAADIPADGDLVAGYADSRWSDDDWRLFPGKTLVLISVNASNDQGQVLDVENGAATPEQAPGWCERARKRGVTPTVYVNRSNVDAVRVAFNEAGVPQPQYWLADYSHGPTIPDGYVAVQYANSAMTGGHYDVSAVANNWPGVDKEASVDFQHPEYIGEAVAVVVLKVGEVGRLRAAFRWPPAPPAHPEVRERVIERKAYGHTAKMVPYIIYPPVDPDDDPTEDIDAQPGVFIVAVETV